MTQANIDIGTGPSTGDGDPIRTAFNKVNENFTELYATINQQGITYVNVAGVSSSTGTGATFNITKYANDYAAVVNQQGTGYGVGNVITVWGNIIGGAYTTNDLSITVANIGNAAIGNIRAIGSSGSPSVPILSVAGRTGAVVLTTNDIVGITSYISQANLNTANSSMRSYVDGQITAANAGVTTANTTMKAYVDGQIAAANSAVSGTVVTANIGMRGYVDNTVAANIASTNYNITIANLGMKGYVDSITGQSIYSNVNVKAYTETMGFTNFSNVNVAAYIAGQGITGGSYSNVNATSLITSLGLSNYSNVNVKAYTEAMGFQNFGNANVASYLPTYSGNIAANISKAGKTWIFDSYGNITLPGGATLGITSTNTAILTAATSNTVDIQSSNRSNKLQIDDTMVSVMTGDSHWHFDLNGKLTLPSGANITSYGAGVTTVFDDNGVIITQQVGVNAFSVTSASGVRAIAGGNIWTFNGNGSLSFPDATIQTTAYTGSTYGNVQVATYLPTYSGNIANIRLGSSGVLTFADNTVQTTAYINSVNTAAISGNVLTLDFNLSTQIVTHSADISNVAITNGPGNLSTKAMTVVLSQDATGGRTISGYYKTQDGIGLDIDTTALAVNIYTFLAVNNGSGTSLYAFSNGTNFI